MTLHKTFTLDIDLKRDTFIEQPTVIANDSNKFIINIFDDGEPFDLSNVTSVTIAHTRLDRKTIVNSGTKTGPNQVTFIVDRPETSFGGSVKSLVQLYNGDSRISTFTFTYRVNTDPTANYTTSNEEKTLIQVVLGEGPKVIQDAIDVTAEATTAKTTAEEKANLAETAALNAESKAQLAEIAATTAQEKAQLAEEKATFANAQGEFAKTEAERAKAEADRLAETDVSVLDNKLILQEQEITEVKSQLAHKANISEIDTLTSSKANRTEVESLASVKADKSYVDSNFTTLDTKINAQASGSPKGTYATLSALQTAFPTGNSNIYVVSADGKWYYWNETTWTAGGVYQSTTIGDGSVTNKELADGVYIEKLNEVKTQQTINLFNPKKAIKGLVLTNGFFYTSTEVFTSDFIPVTANEKLYKNTGSGSETSFYDSNKNFISQSKFPTNLITVPDNADISYVRLTVDPRHKPFNEYMVHRGETEQPYVPFEYYEIENLKVQPSSLDSRRNKEFLRKKMLPDFSIPTLKPYPLANNPVITKSHVTDIVGTSVWFTADPFIVYEKGVYHMFFEVAYNGVEEIGHAYSYNLTNWIYTKIVLPKSVVGHRSAYPHVFKHNGEYYMLPDTAYDIKLYKATNFPYDWELVETLLTPPTTSDAFVDTNLFEFDGIWYMLTSDRNNLRLYCNRSGDFKNKKWSLHSTLIPQNATERGFRCAGNPFIGEDSVIIPVQVTPVDTGLYGEYTYWYKLTNISPTTCTSSRLGLALPPQKTGRWETRGVHHISHCVHQNKVIYAIDGRINSEYAIGIYEDGEQVIAASMSPISKVIPAKTWTGIDVQINAGGFDTYYFIDRYNNKKPHFDFSGLYLINVQINQPNVKFRVVCGTKTVFLSTTNVGSKIVNVEGGSFYIDIYSESEFTINEDNTSNFVDVIKLA